MQNCIFRKKLSTLETRRHLPPLRVKLGRVEIAAFTCLLLLVATTFIHYEVLRLLTVGLPVLQIRPRLRLQAGLEALNGMRLIGWTASFTYLSMERFWGHGQR